MKIVKRVTVFLAICLFFASIGRLEADAYSTEQFIIINKSTNELAFFDNGELVRTFPVGTGREEHLTPEGRFPIVNKIKNRPYYTDNIPGGDPRNPLGDRWLGLNARGTYGTTYAIHGNNNPDSIGKYVSAGCVRMYDDDIHWLFERVNVHTDVLILRSSRSFEQIAESNGYELKQPVRVYVNGEELSDRKALLENGRVLAPMRAVFESLGATVRWDSANRHVYGEKDDASIRLTVDSRTAIIDGESMQLDIAPMIQSGRTYIPVRVVADTLGASLDWNQKERKLDITRSETPEEPTRLDVDVMLNGEPLEGSQQPFIKEGVTYLPLRDMFEALEVSFEWKQAERMVTAWDEDIEMSLVVGEKMATVNQESIELLKEPFLIEGRVYVPVRFITEGFQAGIRWDQSERTVYLITNE